MSLGRWQILLLATAAGALPALFFQAGRESVRYQPTSDIVDNGDSIKRYGTSQQPQSELETVDATKATVENFDTVSFSELYDLMRSAKEKTRSKWANQLDALPPGPRKFSAIDSFYKTYVQIDPQAAGASALSLRESGGRRAAVNAMAEAAPAPALPQIAEMLGHLHRSDRWPIVSIDVIDQWSQIDPVAASLFVEQHRDDFSSNMLLFNWAQIDPTAARTWLDQQPVTKRAGEAIQCFVSGWFDVDRFAAEKYLISNATDTRFQDAIRGTADSLIHSSPDELRNFVLQLPDDKAKKAAVDAAVRTAKGVVLGVTSDWHQPPEKIANWLMTLPPELWRPEIADIVFTWMREDATSASAWLDRLPTASRDIAVREYCATQRAEDIEAVANLSKLIRDPKLREQALTRFVHQLEQDSDDATEIIDKSQLSAKQKTQLKNLIPTR